MKRSKVYGAWKIVLSFLFAFSFMNGLTSSTSLVAREKFALHEEISINEEKSEATISFSDLIQEGVTIESIQNPDGSIMDILHTPQYKVKEDNTYTFVVTYREGTETEAITTEKKVKVIGLQEKVKEDTHGVVFGIPLAIQPRSVVSDGKVSIELVEYMDGSGLSNMKTMTVKVHVDFEDTISANKKMKFTLPEGLKYLQIPVAGSYDTTGVNTEILSILDEGSALSNAITRVTLPKKGTLLNYTYGDIEYEFVSGTKSATIEFKVKVDDARYYKEMTLKRPIAVSASKAGTLIGNATHEVVVNGPVNKMGEFQYYHSYYSTKEVLSSTTTEVSTGNTNLNQWFMMLNGSNLDQKYGYAKSVKYTIYYPEGMIYTGMYGISTNDYTITEDLANNRVIVESKPGVWATRMEYYVKYEVPKGLAEGRYNNPAMDTLEITYYDDTQLTQSLEVLYGVDVIDPNSVENKLNIVRYATGFYDLSVPNSYSHGPFVVFSNDTAGVKKNQEIHFTIDPNWQVSRVHIPFKTPGSKSVSDIKYRTNKDSSWREMDESKLIHVDGNIKAIGAAQAGLDADEFFIEVKATIEEIPIAYTSGNVSSYQDRGSVLTYGKLKPGVDSADVKMSIYDKNDPTKIATYDGKVMSSQSQVAKTTASNSKALVYNAKGEEATQVTAGDDFKVDATIQTHSYPYGTSQTMNAPEIYLRQPKGMTIAIDDLKLTDQGGTPINGWTYTSRMVDEETFYTILLPDSFSIGYYFQKDSPTMYYMRAIYDVSTNVRLVGNYDIRDLLTWGRQDYVATTNTGSGIRPVQDQYDMDGDGNTTEYLMTVATKGLVVAENKNVLVETFLSLAGEEPKLPYNPANPETKAYFTPGTDADYTVRIRNNGDVPADAVSTYIPIPKTGSNFGVNFQEGDFNWDMKIVGAIANNLGYEVSYSSDANASNYKTTATYTATAPSTEVQKKSITMVRILATSPVAPGSEVSFKLPLKVDETFETASQGGKTGKMNIYNPVYEVVSEPFTGNLPGTKVGTELVVSEVGGTVFFDKDADGLYDKAKGDIPISGHEVKLYKWNEATNGYDEVINPATSAQYTAVTNSNGVYNFNNNTGMWTGNYAVRFVEVDHAEYQYTIHNQVAGNEGIDSDATIANDIPNPGDTYRGWAINIDPTRPDAKSIGAGFLKYNPPIDLQVYVDTTPNTVKVGNSITVGSHVEPTFWESIKAESDAYTWIIDDASNITWSNNEDGTVTINALSLPAGVMSKTLNLRLKVTDIYGNQKTSTSVPITVTNEALPTLEVVESNVFVGDTLSNYVSNITKAEDASGVVIVPIIMPGVTQNTIITQNVPVTNGKYTTEGTYAIRYALSDRFGNITFKDSVVRVHTEPVITANNAEYTIGDIGIDASVNALASAKWKQAPSAIGGAIEVDITSSINKTVSGPSTNFSVIGTYTVTFSVSANGRIATKDVTVKVKDVEPLEPTLTMKSELYGYEGESIDLLSGILHAEDEFGTEITLVEGSNVSITTPAPMSGSTLTKAGTYVVTYKVKDVRGIETTATTILKVNGNTLVHAKAQKYTVGDTTIATQVAAAVSASWLKAGNTVGEIPVKTMVSGPAVARVADQMTYEILSGPSAAFDTVGIYEVEYTAENVDGVRATKNVKIILLPEGSISEKTKTLYISADGFSIKNEEANILSEVLAIDAQHANARAFKTLVAASGEVIDYQDITDKITVDAKELAAIQRAPKEGGIYKLTIRVSDVGKSVTKVVYVNVEGTHTPPPLGSKDGALAISAKDFSVNVSTAKALDEAEAIVLAKVQAQLLNSDDASSSIGRPIMLRVNATELASINSSAKHGRVYPLSFNATYVASDGSVVRNTTTVNVTIDDTLRKASTIIDTGDTTNLFGYICVLLLAGSYLFMRKCRRN